VETGNTIRLRLTLHYDGSDFHGWQIQPGQRTVQGELQAALSRLADRPRNVVGSGRTDTGVHATGQVASVDMSSSWTPADLLRSLNAVLPSDIWVQSVRRAAPGFHPRYDAVARTYTYRIGTGPEAASPFHAPWCWALPCTLDRRLLDLGARALVGKHSFRAFAKSGQPERGDLCSVSAAGWSEWSLGFRFDITADRYLHRMVRYLVGTLVDVARLRRPLDDVAELLELDRSLECSPPAPPQGLFLARVEYPNDAAGAHDSQPSERRTAPA